MSREAGLPPPQSSPLIPFPGWRVALGPGVVWLALAQGSGELIWWPYIVAKYGLAFLFLLLPACLLQGPLNFHIGNYTMCTGESIFQGFIRLNRFFALLLWALMTVAFFWFGSFASAGGTALAALTHFPAGWSLKGQTLFWAYASMGLFLGALLLGKVAYQVVEKTMWAVAIITVVGLVTACFHPEVLKALPAFLQGLLVPQSLPRPWDPADSTKLLTAMTFAGLGGFWTLFYSYWLREKGVGMAWHIGHITSPMTGRLERIPLSGCVPSDEVGLPKRWESWRRFLLIDSAIGIGGNILTTLMTCLLAFALLHPSGLLPQRYELAVVQSRFFEVQWGMFGRGLFLIVAAAFLADTWLATVDAVARIHTDCVLSFFPVARKFSARGWYFLWVGVLSLITSVTVLFDEPGKLILLSAVLGFVGTVLFTGALFGVSYRLLPRLVPRPVRPGRWAFVGLGISYAAYLALASAYLWAITR